MQQGTLPQLNLSTNLDRSSYEGYIYMDWIGDSDEFDYLNYKSLESLLRVYPKAKVTVNLIASDGAHYYKMGNLISKHYFEKYLKYGYDVKVKVVYRKFRERFVNDVMPPGAAYWNEEFVKCCESTKAADIIKYRDIPAHLYFYLRFFSLWAHGGLYSDFSWIHTKVLLHPQSDRSETVAVPNGAIINIVCTNESAVSSIGASHVYTAPVEAHKHSRCKSSALLAFPKNSSVAYCMMLQYNSTDTALRRCFAHDTQTEGVNCIVAALKRCFAENQARNSFLYTTEASAVGQILVGCDDIDSPPKATGVRSVVGNLPTVCRRQAGEHHKALLEGRLSDGGAQRSGSLFADGSVVWLRDAAYDGDWAVPKEGSALGKLLRHLVLPVPGPYYADLITDPISSAQGATTEGGRVPTYSPYPLKVLSAVSAAEARYLEAVRDRRVTHLSPVVGCRRYNYTLAALPEHMRNQVLPSPPSTIFATLITPASKQARVSCAPLFIVPGFMKAGTTYLFGSLMSHPQLLHTLRGVSFKETGCYGAEYVQSKQQARKGVSGLVAHNRMHCYPFVEAHEPMHFGDGTVWYNSHTDTPGYLLADNPDMKVIFSIRHPIHRTQSQHRFIYKMLHLNGGSDLNEVVAYLLDPNNDAGNGEGSLTSLHDQAQRILDTKVPALRRKLTEQLVWNFQNKARSDSKKYRALNQFIKYSIYFPPIYYWFQHIPRGNVLVVPVELLQARHQSEEAKLAYLRNLSTPQDYEVVVQAHAAARTAWEEQVVANKNEFTQRLEKVKRVADEEKAAAQRARLQKQWAESDAKALRARDEPLDDAYTVAQFNRVYRYV